MVKINVIKKHLDKELKVKSIKDLWSKNGLQVNASDDIKKIGLSVDACMDVFEKAKRSGCDMLIVHHGLLKPNQKDVSGLVKKGRSFLLKNKISLYGAHIPLDVHKKYGNNANILRMIGLEPKSRFSEVGYMSRFKKRKTVGSVAKTLQKSLRCRCGVWGFGKGKIKTVAVNSGFGGSEVDLAIKKGIDLLIIGEGSHGSYLRAKDGKQNVIVAGHYKTEIVGIKKIGEMLSERFEVKTVFIDNPTGM